MTASSPPLPPRPRLVRCPTCGQPARFDAGNPWRPFCSERCRSIDLGAWATEAYRMGEAGPGEAANQAPEPPPGRPH